MDSKKITELKNDASKSDIRLSELLNRAKILFVKDKEFLELFSKEIKGYHVNDEIPDYRNVQGELKGWNPYNGWLPCLFNDDPKTQELVSSRKIIQSILELEKLLNTQNKELAMNIPSKANSTLSKVFGMDTKFCFFINHISIESVIINVKNKLLDFLIEKDNFSDISINEISNDIIFPDELINKLPKDLQSLIDDFHFNYSNNKSNPSIFVLRRILPLSIIRKYQKDNKENEIKDSNGDHFDTKGLLGKIQNNLSNTRIYKDVISHKQLIDGSQHNYTLNIQMSDVKNCAISLRIFLDDIF